MEATCVEDWVGGFVPGFPTGVAELITTDGGKAAAAVGGAEGSAEVSPVPGTSSSRTPSSTGNENQTNPLNYFFLLRCFVSFMKFSTDWK